MLHVMKALQTAYTEAVWLVDGHEGFRSVDVLAAIKSPTNPLLLLGKSLDNLFADVDRQRP